ncbi:WD40 repeat-like protein [Violaceomyces palustris]|uniref:WD40 repeat-like protein n=1 Tax=Violaceomyces palustris TaxID=1673888 RepID=A0ACD0P2G5_9BASI|nr:WD40 repeat-like protein [Violaceomyces palustris]
MVRSYLRHEPTQAFGLISSNAANAILDQDSKTAYVPALEDVIVWDVKRGQILSVWHEVGHRSQVTAIARSPHPGADTFAVGYADGSVRLWSAASSTSNVTFNGHKKAVTAIAFDSQGLRLATASQDTDIILWDIVAENGLYRLRGHRDVVTDLAFVQTPPASHLLATGSSSTTAEDPSSQPTSAGYLLSTSKDGFLKLWDLSLQHCVETVVPGRGEIWSLAVSQKVPLSLSVDPPKKGSEAEEEEEVGQREQIDSTLPASGGGALVLTGSSEGELRVWEISAKSLIHGVQALREEGEDGKDGTAESSLRKMIVPRGTVPLSASHRVTRISFCGVSSSTTSQGFISVSSSDKSVQIFRLRSSEEVAKKMARRKKRAKEKAEKKMKAEGKQSAVSAKTESVGVQDPSESEVTWSDRIEPYTIVRPEGGKLRSFSVIPSGDPGSARMGLDVLCALTTNALEIYHVPPPPKTKAEKAEPIEASLSCGLDLPGHRADVRALALSSDDVLLASACGAGLLKIWNVGTGRCIRTLPCGYALSVAWLPGDQHVLVGCKDGTLRSYDVRAGIAIETIKAHEGPIWSVAVQPNGLGCVTASADKECRFWEFEMREDDGAEEEGRVAKSGEDEESRRQAVGARQQLSLVHVRTLKMTDDILCARFSPNGKLLALSLLDNTVKVFYADSLKFFLSLYGHKLPVLSLDISGDSKLCVTVSADKNVKIWGLDFGDCHKSIFAHEESIMAVAFERGMQGGGLMGGREGESHHFWTVAKDGMLKHWDGDRFELIQELEGHHGEIWAVAAGSKGTLAVTAGADRSIRTWEKTDEPLFLEEERERQLEKAYESAGQVRDEDRPIGSLAPGGDREEASLAGPEADAVSKRTTETMMAGEKLVEALELGDQDLEAQRLAANAGAMGAPPRNPIVMAAFSTDEEPSAEKFVLRTVEKILPAQLEDALLVLPFDKVISLLKYLDLWARKEWNISLVSKILFFLLRTHQSQIVSNRIMRTTLVSLRGHLRSALERQKTTLGFNLAALKFIRSQHVSMKTTELYEKHGLDMDEETVRQKIEAGTRRKRKIAVA